MGQINSESVVPRRLRAIVEVVDGKIEILSLAESDGHEAEILTALKRALVDVEWGGRHEQATHT